MADEQTISLNALNQKMADGNSITLGVAKSIDEQKTILKDALDVAKGTLKRTPTKAQQEEAAREAARKGGTPTGAAGTGKPDKLKLEKDLFSAFGFPSLGLDLKDKMSSWSLGTGSALKGSLAKIAGPAMIAAGIALAVKDGMDGYLKAEEWGVSGASAALGGALGGTSSGWKGAFQNAGKWAMIGAGIGFPIVPPIGALVGGLLGGALGGILGFIGGEKIAKSFDAVADWFTGELVPGVKGAWNAILPDWLKKLDFAWSDLLPKFIVDLYQGGVDKPGYWENVFKWQDLVPEFILKIVGAAGKQGKQPDGTFSWKALLPDWMISAFDSSVEAAGKAVAFDWRALLPDFIKTLFPGLNAEPLTIAKGLEKVGAFDWRVLLPDFITKFFPSLTGEPLTFNKLFGAVGAFDWLSLLPVFLQELIADPTQFASADYKWEWKKLLPVFLQDFLGVGDKPQPEGAFTWKSLMPPFILSVIEGAKGAVKNIGAKFEWTSLLPKFITDFITTPVTWDEATSRFEWKDLLPTFITDILAPEAKKLIDGLPAFTWKSLVPEFILDIVEGRGVFSTEGGGFLANFRKDVVALFQAVMDRFAAIVDDIASVVPGMTSSAEAATKKLTEMAVFDKKSDVVGFDDASEVDFKKMSEGVAAGTLTQADIVGLLKEESDDLKASDIQQLIQSFNLQDLVKGMKFETYEDEVLQFKEGGMAYGTGMALLHGEQKKPELVIDNIGTQQFLAASEIMSKIQASEAAMLEANQTANAELRDQRSMASSGGGTNFTGGDVIQNTNVQNIVETKIKYTNAESSRLLHQAFTA